MAVLAGLYQVEPWSKLLDDLTPQQQVQAAVLADMWELTAASEAAVGVLQAANVDTNILSAVLEQLLSMAAFPDCLHPVFERVLLSQYGDLEAVWDSQALQDSLLALPLHAMELLLASDKLKVGIGVLCSVEHAACGLFQVVPSNCNGVTFLGTRKSGRDEDQIS
jgi:hypothetical protein